MVINLLRCGKIRYYQNEKYKLDETWRSWYHIGWENLTSVSLGKDKTQHVCNIFQNKMKFSHILSNGMNSHCLQQRLIGKNIAHFLVIYPSPSLFVLPYPKFFGFITNLAISWFMHHQESDTD